MIAAPVASQLRGDLHHAENRARGPWCLPFTSTLMPRVRSLFAPSVRIICCALDQKAREIAVEVDLVVTPARSSKYSQA
jgi:hypothetical protein